MINFAPHELQTRILVVENITHMARIVVEMVRAMGFRDVHRVGNVVHAYQFVISSRPNLIIGEAAIQPHGVTRLCKTLRVAADSPDRTVPVIITVAEPTGAAVAAARDAGCHAILAKPVAAASLATKIAGILRSPPRFVASRSYTGPDRRRAAMPLKGPERRSHREAPPEHRLSVHEVLGIDPDVLAGTKPPPPHLIADDNERALVSPQTSPVSRKVAVSQLQPGMELAESIKSGPTLVVVPRGVVLTRELVPRLVELASKGKIPPAVLIRV